MATDSLYADSIMDYLIENGITDCGTDCRDWFGLLHSHSGRWIHEEDFEWVWEGTFANDTICPICNRTLDEKENIESN